MALPRSKSATLPVRRGSNSHPSVILKEGWITVSAEKKTKLFHRCTVSIPSMYRDN